MRKITIFAAGSQGDIQPCVALGSGLQRAGYEVCLAAPEDFAGFVQRHGVGFHPLRGDVQKIMASDTARKFMETSGSNPLKSIQAIRTLIAPVVQQMAADALKACRSAEGIICLGVFSAFGQTFGEALGKPVIHIEPTPLLPSRAFPAPSWPIQKNLGGLHNIFSGWAMLQVIWLWYQPFVNDFRKQLGLSRYTFGRFLRDLKNTPMLSAYSPSIIPHPADWKPSIHITGYFFLDQTAAWQPPEALLDFLENGEPPVYIGFGSMAGENPAQLAQIALEALARCGQRGVLLTGWGGMKVESLPENVYVLNSAPHAWLFPRMAAVVHHGGAGTTAEGLRAGIPTVIVPFAFDQSFWGARVKAMGFGPQPIPRKGLTAERLAQAIWVALTHPTIRQRSRTCGNLIRQEDGLGNAVEVVRQIFGAP